MNPQRLELLIIFFPTPKEKSSHEQVFTSVCTMWIMFVVVSSFHEKPVACLVLILFLRFCRTWTKCYLHSLPRRESNVLAIKTTGPSPSMGWGALGLVFQKKLVTKTSSSGPYFLAAESIPRFCRDLTKRDRQAPCLFSHHRPKRSREARAEEDQDSGLELVTCTHVANRPTNTRGLGDSGNHVLLAARQPVPKLLFPALERVACQICV